MIKILLDTNLLIYREDHTVINDKILELTRILYDSNKYKIVVHPMTIQDLSHIKNSDERAIFYSKVKVYEIIERPPKASDEFNKLTTISSGDEEQFVVIPKDRNSKIKVWTYKATEEGEIVIRTEEGVPNGLFMCYYGDEEKTNNAWHDGYYHTGDTAYYDEDGYLWYVGRVDDVIKSSGYRIGPFEIENEIMKLPYVLECAVTSVPDPIRGQAIKASIVLVNGQEGTDKLKSEIMKSLKKNIASYKWPKILDFTKELPKTISGKIRRKEIKENDWNENADEE